MSASGSAAQRRRAFIERIERLEEERKTLADDIASVYDELKADGHDKAAVKIIVKIRRKEDGLAKWVGYSGTVDEYLADLGMLPKLEEARAGARVRENIEEIGAEINRQIASGEIVAVAQTGELTDTQEQPETANTVPAQDSGGTTIGESPSDKSNAARPASVDAHVNDGGLAGKVSDEVVTVVGSESGTVPHSNPQPAASLGADKAGDVPPPSSPATLSVNQKCQKHKRGEFCGFAYSQASCWRCNQAAAQQSEAA